MGKSQRKRAAVNLIAAILLLAGGTGQALAAPHSTEIVRIWQTKPPGTEAWTGSEVEMDAELPGAGKVHIVTNVTTPTMTVYRPQPGSSSGTAVLVAPGGAFRALAWDLEGTEVAHWLSRRGITAFVLKYRVRPPSGSDSPRPESFDDWAMRTKAARELAIADVQQALRHIQANAQSYAIKTDRIGMIGFSAGAMAMMEAAVSEEEAARPDFAIAVYGALIGDKPPPIGSPPLFIVAAQDDPRVPPARSIALFQRWTGAGLPAELHLFEKGGHGFGMRAPNLPAGKWPSGLEAWLASKGLITLPF